MVIVLSGYEVKGVAPNRIGTKAKINADYSLFR